MTYITTLVQREQKYQPCSPRGTVRTPLRAPTNIHHPAMAAASIKSKPAVCLCLGLRAERLSLCRKTTRKDPGLFQRSGRPSAPRPTPARCAPRWNAAQPRTVGRSVHLLLPPPAAAKLCENESKKDAPPAAAAAAPSEAETHDDEVRSGGGTRRDSELPQRGLK